MNPKTTPPTTPAANIGLARAPKSPVLATLLSCTVLLALSPAAAAQAIATDVTGPGDQGLRYDVTKNAGYSSSAVIPGAPERLYVSWLENNGAVCQVRVSAYNSNDLNPSWTRVDRKVNGVARPANQGINRNPSADVRVGWGTPVLAVHNAMLYAAWVEASQIRVARYNGDDANPNWVFVDGNALSVGINMGTGAAKEPSMISFGGKLYVCWSEISAIKKKAISQIRVKAYNGTGFTLAEPGANTGINQNSAYNAYDPSLGIMNGSQLFVAFEERDGVSRVQVRVKAYAGGTTWNSADGGGVNGIAQDPLRNAIDPVLIGHNSKLYLVTLEDKQVRVARYDGSSWMNVDGNQPRIGLNQTPSEMALTPAAVVHNGLLHVSWAEGWTHVPQVRMKVFNGVDTAPAWTFADGGGPEGLVIFEESHGVAPNMASCNSKLYINWSESDDIMVGLMNNE